MFITFEGIEGAGKTTQIRYLSEYLSNQGYDCLITREPGGTEIGRQIRAILLDPDNDDLDPMTELLLYMADRIQHVRRVVLPALRDGKTVLCDRYVDATIVYQGVARGLDIERIRELHQILLDNLKPDMTFLFDLPPEIGLSRAWRQIKNGTRTKDETRFEKERLCFHEKVREGYLSLAGMEPSRFRIINALMDENRVMKEVIRHVQCK
jgi:dTMP kinase